MVMSWISVTTALAAEFMRSKALRSLGFSKLYLAHILMENLVLDTADQATRQGFRLLGECPAVHTDDNPCVWEQGVWLLEGLDIFKSGTSC